MQTPALILGLILSTLYGALFHLWRGGRAGRLLLYLALAWVGFWSGHLAGAWLEWSFFDVGQLHLGAATIGSVIALAAGHWLSLVEIDTGTPES